MRSLVAPLALVLSALAGTGMASTAASAAPVGPPTAAAAKAAAKPDLVARGGSAAYADGKLSLKLKFRDKGPGRSAKSTGAFAVSKDKLVSDDDRGLGMVKVPAIAAGKGAKVTVTLTVPGTVPAGTYYVVYCADYKTKVPETNEGNNCGSTKNAVKITPVTTPPPPPAGTVTIAAVAGPGGTVTASATGGTCAGTSCSVASGAGTVTFTPLAQSGYAFTGWSGCAGYTGTSSITFTNPTAGATCTAVFTATTVPPPPTTTTVVVSYKGAGSATVTGATDNGTCVGTGSASATGSCTVPTGAATVTLTATAFLGQAVTWSGCTGTVSGNTIRLVDPTAATTCTATPAVL